MRKVLTLILFIFIGLVFIFPFKSLEAENQKIFAVYFTGIGCSHCAKTDPYVLEKWLNEYPDLIVVEYEIYQQLINGSLLYEYNTNYQSGLGIPLLIFSKNQSLLGDRAILIETKKLIEKVIPNKFPTPDGNLIDLNDLEINSLAGQPKIWHQEKILIKVGQRGDSKLLKNLLIKDDLAKTLENIEFKKIEPIKVALSGKSVKFDWAIQIDDWIFAWNGEELDSLVSSIDKKRDQVVFNGIRPEITLVKILSLAFADSINPCAFAVLTLMLVAILTHDPTKRKNILLAGLYFIIAVFIMYLIYGIIIIRSFQLIQTLTSVRLVLYKVLGGLAIILGILNIKDFVRYKPGGFLTEMPMFLRPKIKKIILGLTSPKGAFIIGVLVTIFLLPCTIGPYIICGGILCALDLLKTLPYLFLYNLVFILPMLAIVLIIYFGITKIEDVSGWKDRNIRYLHLVAGLIIFSLGLAMILGLV